MKLEEQIQQLIINKLDVEGAALKASEMILNDQAFFTALENQLLDNYGHKYSLVSSVERLVVDKLATAFIDKHGRDILEMVEPLSVAME